MKGKDALRVDADTFDHLRALADFAYRQGHHEMGYDPVRVAEEEVARLRTALVDLLNHPKVKMERHYLDKGIGAQTADGKAILNALAALDAAPNHPE